MYAKIINGAVEKYPYSIGQLRKENPNVSFPRVLSNEILIKWDVHFVLPQDPPVHDYATQNCERVNPTFRNGSWVETWVVSEISNEEKRQRNSDKALEIRNQRDMLLQQTDWRFRSDMNPSQAWIDYCQALRDIPAQAGFPWSVQWPVAPT